MSEICSPITYLLVMSGFTSLPVLFHQFSTLIALGDVDLCFLLMFVIKTNAVEEETT
jgi:hypothetical protein